MSNSRPVTNNCVRQYDYDERKPLSPRERFLGQIIALLVILLAILLQSL